MAELAPRGAFILFEGIDRCGKSTQAVKLVENLNAEGVNAELWRFPDRTTEIGQMINAYLANAKHVDDAAIHLLFAANRWEKRDHMLQKLSGGTTLVVDRYSYSGVAFTAAKHTPGLDRQWCMAPEVGLPCPDVVLYLDLTIEQAAARGGFGEERYEKEQFQREVQQQFAVLKDASWRVLDATQAMEDIQHQVLGIAKGVIATCAEGKGKLRTFWESPENGQIH